MKTREFSISTDHEGMYNITARLREVIRESGVQSGLAVVYCPHTTAGITINETLTRMCSTTCCSVCARRFPTDASSGMPRAIRPRTSNAAMSARARRAHRGRQAHPRHLAGRVFLRVRRSASSPLLY